MLDVIILAGDVLASGSDSDGFDPGILLLLSGFLFYGYVFFRYRNADKRHKHESETKSTMLNVQVADQRAGSVKGVKNARMSGANNRNVRGAQNSLGNTGLNADSLMNVAGSFLNKK